MTHKPFDDYSNENRVAFNYETQEWIRIVKYLPENRLVCVDNVLWGSAWDHPLDVLPIETPRKQLFPATLEDAKKNLAEVTLEEIAAAGWDKYLPLYRDHTVNNQRNEIYDMILEQYGVEEEMFDETPTHGYVMLGTAGVDLRCVLLAFSFEHNKELFKIDLSTFDGCNEITGDYIVKTITEDQIIEAIRIHAETWYARDDEEINEIRLRGDADDLTAVISIKKMKKGRIIIESFASVSDVISSAIECAKKIESAKTDETYGILKSYKQLAVDAPVRLVADTDLSRIVLRVTSIDGVDRSEEAARALKQIVNLTSLSLYGDGICDLNFFSDMQNLQELAIFQENAKNVEAISKLANVRVLKLYCPCLPCVETLLQMRDLLHLYVSLEHEDDYSWLSKMKDLIFLSMSGCKHGLAPIGELTQLRELYFNAHADSPVDLTPLERLTSLHSLSIDCATHLDLTPLFKLKGLQRLRIGAKSVSGKDVWAIKELLNLKEFGISNIEW